MRNTGQFTSVRVEGGLLSPDLLGRLINIDLEGASPESYHLVAGERITESVSRSWNRLRLAWIALQALRQQAREGAAATGTTRERWLLVLFQELGYGRLTTSKGMEIEGRSYPVSHLWQNTLIHLVGFGVDLDRRSAGVAGAARISPHGMVQELLNRAEEYLWGFVSNGLRLRILRDNRSLTRQAYIEFDLEGIFEGELYPDFVLLWLLCHESRVEAERPAECWLERWSEESYRQGARALDALRGGIERAITLLGRGFIDHRANTTLRDHLRSGELNTQDFYRQILRLVYRLIFLFVSEDRGALLDPRAPLEAKETYLNYYSTNYLRQLAERVRGGAHSDLYQGLCTVMGLLGDEGCSQLALPALGSYLWSSKTIPDLESCALANRFLLETIRSLAFTQRDRSLWRVDYRNLGSEELGSIYESLLELHPQINLEAATFELKISAGHERKTTGSYYTPHSLVQSLLDTALEPVLEEKLSTADPENAILEVKICDPACGSGHFLIAAAHRIARRLASVRTGDEEPSPQSLQGALREVIGHCLYGVDLNPMAVELCKVSLWMEALEPGRPLSFLDHHIQCGNSLLGTTSELLDQGIPQEAFKVLTGDDKAVVSALKKRNKEERDGQRSLLTAEGEGWTDQHEVLSRLAQLDSLSEDTLQAVHLLEEKYGDLISSDDYRMQKNVADAWCASFVWPKRKGAPPAITEDIFERTRTEPTSIPQAVWKEVWRLSEQYGFFHWHLAFPEVFRGKNPGFDVVLGNPPWEQTEFSEKEWFADRNLIIANAATGADRKVKIESLRVEDPTLFESYVEAYRYSEGVASFVRNAGTFPLCGRGKLNLYALFAELDRSLITPGGRVGVVVPSGIATDDTTKYFFADLVEKRSLVSLYDFENRKKLFPAVDSRVKFCLLTLTGRERPAKRGAEFLFFALQPEELADPERRFRLEPEDFALMNPNTRTCPIFRSRRDAELTQSIYHRVPVLIKEGDPGENPWGISFKQGLFNMTSDSGLFQTRLQLENDGFQLEGARFVKDEEVYLPLYEAKMIHHFDHRWGTYEGTKVRDVSEREKADPSFAALPRYWVAEREVGARLTGRWDRGWLMGWRDICRSTDERTVIASILPRTGLGNKIPIFIDTPRTGDVPLLGANLCSFSLDYVARQKIGGTTLNFFYLKQLPVLPPELYNEPCPWDQSLSLRDWIIPRVIELVYTSHDLKPFAQDCGYERPPFAWDPERRFQLRCKLDAAFFHLYGIARDDVDYIMETFPIVRRHDERAYREYRTKLKILEIYEALSNNCDEANSNLRRY